MEKCIRCGRILSRDEIGLTKKLINRGCTEFYCISCLAVDFHVTEELLQEKIEHFKAQGCTLFCASD